MLGDFNIAEPGAMIGFAGPRVIRETIGKDLPKGFQSAEFVLDHGFLDFIVDRKELRTKLSTLFKMLA
jgi:acetyl-CoA carboxylase carboxyl transferase subunit beta